MNSKLISILKYLFLMAVAFGLLFLAFKNVSVKAIFIGMSKAKIGWLLLSIAVSTLAFVCRAYRWKLLISSLGYTPSLKRTTFALMIGYFANLALPRLGEVTRCGSLSKTESIPFSSLLGTVIVERIIDVLTLLVCLLLTSFLEYKRLGEILSDTIISPIHHKWNQLVSSPALIIALVVFIAIGISILIYIFKGSNLEGKGSKFSHLIKGFLQGLKSVAMLKRPWFFIFLSIFIWFLALLGIYICFLAISATSHLGWTVALLIMVIGGLGMAAPVQGGIGAFHLLVSQGLMLYGLSREDGLIYATLVHSLSIIVTVVFGIASLVLLFFENKPYNQKEVSHSSD